MKTNLKQLQNALIYTNASIARVLGFTAKRIRRTMVWWSGFWIWVEGKRPRLYKKSLFQADFADFRKAGAKEYSVKRTSADSSKECYSVTREIRRPGCSHTTSTHTVNIDLSTIAPVYACECEDYTRSSVAFKAPACKHIYAVLNSQGFDSLKSAIDATVQKYAKIAREAIGL